MAEDMVASLTLRLQNQLSAGLDDIKAQFTSLQGTLDALNGTMGELRDLMASLRGPTQVVADLKAVETQAKAAADSVRNVGAAGAESGGLGSKSMDWVGGAIAGYAGYDSIKSYADFQALLLHKAAITEGLSGPAAYTEVDRITDMLDQLALKTGQSSASLEQAYGYLITTHMPVKQVDALMPALGQAATAYNVDPFTMGGAVFALNDAMKIAPDQMASTLAAMAMAAKQSHFSTDSFGQLLPNVAGAAESAGMTGRGGADTLFAALEMGMKLTNDAGETATNLREYFQYVRSQLASRTFALDFRGSRMTAGQINDDEEVIHKYHIKPISLLALQENAEAHGIDPLNAMMNYLQNLTKNMPALDRNEVLGMYFHNQQASYGVTALMQHLDEFEAMQRGLAGVDQKKIDIDFATAMQGANIQVQQFDENMAQLERRIGEGLLPVLTLLNTALTNFNLGLDRVDALIPHQADFLLALGAGVVALRMFAGVTRSVAAVLGAGSAATAAKGAGVAAAAEGAEAVAGAEAATGLLAALAAPEVLVGAGVLFELIDIIQNLKPGTGPAGTHWVQSFRGGAWVPNKMPPTGKVLGRH